MAPASPRSVHARVELRWNTKLVQKTVKRKMIFVTLSDPASPSAVVTDVVTCRVESRRSGETVPKKLKNLVFSVPFLSASGLATGWHGCCSVGPQQPTKGKRS